jgi:adhesin transport system membrane fusion protein
MSEQSRAERRSSRAGRWIMWTIAASITGFAVWASTSYLDQITRAPAQVIASARTQIIQSYDGGVIERLAVREGGRVKKGQLLLSFAPARTEAQWREIQAKVAGLKSTVIRLNAEILDKPLVFDATMRPWPQYVANQTALYMKRRQALHEEIRVYEKALGLAVEELATTEPLLKNGDVGLAEVLRLRRQVSDIEGQIINRRNKYFQDAQTELAKAQEDLAAAEQVLEQRHIQLENTEIHAPMAGVVKNIRFTTLGAVVKPGEDILELVPDNDDLILEAKVKPGDIGFIRPGLATTIKVDAYDYAIFGALTGEVFYISADTLKEQDRGVETTYYIVRIRASAHQLTAPSGAKMQVIPGMTATVEMLTGRKTIMQYLTKPIIKTLHESLTER